MAVQGIKDGRSDLAVLDIGELIQWQRRRRKRRDCNIGDTDDM